MKLIFRQNQLYTFMLYCNGCDKEKVILDCGAGGKMPPLALFKDHGYVTHGIDISDEQIEDSRAFEKKHDIQLNIVKGDMLEIPHEDESMNFVYSYNSIFHMSKKEIGTAVSEIHRVLSKGGLAFINFPTVIDSRAYEGEQVGENEYVQEEYGERILHSYFEVDEPEKYFSDFNIIYKENRVRNGFRSDGEKITRGFVDYIIEKK